jgi:hypothetical protein
MKLNNPFKPRLNDVTNLPCAHGHLTDSPHDLWRFADAIGWFKRDPVSGEFLFDAKGPSIRRTDGRPSEEAQIKLGNRSFVWCLADMPQASVDSIPGSHEPKAAHTGFGLHWHTYCDPQVLRHMRSYAGRIPTELNSGRWIMPDHPKDIIGDKHPSR